MFAPLAVKKARPPAAHADRAPHAPGGAIQPKRTVGAVNDPLEAQADRMADHVLHAPEASGSRGARSLNSPAPGGEERGQPLDAGSRAFFEPRFGFDFSHVRIFSDETAAESARSIGALAFTSGSHIAFAGGRYQPGTGEGRRLLAHELTHVVQQSQAPAATPAIQRDTPGQTPPAQQPGPAGPGSQVGPLSVTKQFTPDGVSRQDVTKALTDFLYQAQAAQGGQTLHVTDAVKWAVRRMFQGDPTGSANAEAFLAGTALPGSAPEFAAAVARLLPEYVPKSRIAHLATQSPKDTPDKGPKSFGEAAGHVVVDSTVAPLVKRLPIPKDWQEKIIDGARGAVADGLVGLVDQAMSGSPLSAGDKNAIHSAVEAAIKQKVGDGGQQQGGASPATLAQPPSSAPPLGAGGAPGEKIFNLPKIPWDFPTKPVPKPNLPQAPLASDAQAVDKIIKSLDDNSLIPAAAKGTPDAANSYASAQELARSVANLLAAADKKKQYSVDLTIPITYRHVDDLPAIFDKISDIVKQIAAALPGGAANVGEVIISPARTGKDDKFPARRIVKLHGGD